MTVHDYDRHSRLEAVENLRRIVRRTFPTAPSVVGVARKELIELGEVIHTCTISAMGENSHEFSTHAVSPRRRDLTICGVNWAGRLSSSSWELLERVTCEECKTQLGGA